MLSQSPHTRVRIHSHVTQSRFLHVEDALGIGKIRLFAGAYRRGEGLEQRTATGLAWHFVDIADARIVFGALAQAEPAFSYREYKGTPLDSGGAVSRVLSVQVKGENVYVELKSGPGKLTPTGAVTPAGKATIEVNVGLKLYEARRLGAAVLAYLRAWDVMQMLEYRDAVGQPGPYLVVPATSDGSENGHGAPAVASEPAIAPPEPMVPAGSNGDGYNNGRAPVVEQAAAEARARRTAEELFGPDNGDASTSLRYGDGSPVEEKNSSEIQTFHQFVAEKQTPPASRAALQAYYRQRSAVH
jgi:hypothetical protein